MPGLDVSVNVLSLFAFVLVLGIVVDDAIIVGENIYRHQEEHGEGIHGARSRAPTRSRNRSPSPILTTVAAFSPLLFVPGMMGKIFRVIPLIVIPCLLFSLVESLNILPAHLSLHSEARPPGAVAALPIDVRQRPEAVRAEASTVPTLEDGAPAGGT